MVAPVGIPDTVMLCRAKVVGLAEILMRSTTLLTRARWQHILEIPLQAGDPNLDRILLIQLGTYFLASLNLLIFMIEYFNFAGSITYAIHHLCPDSRAS